MDSDITWPSSAARRVCEPGPDASPISENARSTAATVSDGADAAGGTVESAAQPTPIRRCRSSPDSHATTARTSSVSAAHSSAASRFVFAERALVVATSADASATSTRRVTGPRRSSASAALYRRMALVRFVSRIDVFLPGDVVERAPGLWDHLKAMWQPLDLGTERMRDRIEAATFVYELRNAFESLEIDNARSLVVDGTTVFHDSRGVDGDLPDMVLALSDHVSLFGERSQELRLSVEHEEAGLRMILDAIVTPEHGREAPSARLVIVGQLVELDPRPGESAAAYRARLEPLVTDVKLARTLRLQFGAFVSRVQEALGRTFDETRLEVSTEVLEADAMVREEVTAPASEPAPSSAPARREPVASAPVHTVDTAAPARNFTITSDARISALVSGPPPFAVRRRRIEEIEDEVIAALCECERTGAGSIPLAVARRIEEANRLIRDHNRYYPVERNLPTDPATGGLLEMGEPWLPTPALTIDGLRARAHDRARGA